MEASSPSRPLSCAHHDVNLTPEQIERHNELYDEAWKLIKGEINLDGQERQSPGWWASRRLSKAKTLFEKTIAINPAGWNAMFAIRWRLVLLMRLLSTIRLIRHYMLIRALPTFLQDTVRLRPSVLVRRFASNPPER
jgi:hypothetical protein